MKFEYNADTHMSNDFQASDNLKLGSNIPVTQYNNSNNNSLAAAAVEVPSNNKNRNYENFMKFLILVFYLPREFCHFLLHKNNIFIQGGSI